MLLSLPTELAEHVTHHLDIDSFRSLRLVSRSLNQQCLHQFRQRFFRTRTIAWSTESLDRLTRVTSNSYFGPSLCHLIVDATPRFALQLWELEKGIIETELQQEQDLRAELQAQHHDIETRLERETKFWNETRYDRTTLTSVFQHLGRLQSIIFAYDGMKKNFLLFGRRYCECSQNEMSRPVVSTLAAVAMSRLIVQNITIDPQRRHGAVSTGRLEGLSPMLSKFDNVFSGVKVFTLNIRDWRSPDDGFELPNGKASFLIRFLSKMRNLRTLDLSCYNTSDENMLLGMAQHCIYPRLETCRLHLFTIHELEDLLQFLEPTQASLNSLTLSHCISRSADWAQIMVRLAKDVRIQQLELRDLFTRSGARVGFDCTMRRTLNLRAPHLKKELVEQSDRIITGNWGPAWHQAAVAYPFIGLHAL